MAENINNRHADRATNKEPANNSIAINCTSHAIRPGFFCNRSPSTRAVSVSRAPATHSERGVQWLQPATRRTRVQRRFLPPLYSRLTAFPHQHTVRRFNCALLHFAAAGFYLWDTARNFNYIEMGHCVTTIPWGLMTNRSGAGAN